MPQVKDKITGKVISRQPYNKEGADTAASIAKSNPNWDVSYATNDARSRSQVNQAGSGMTGFAGIGSVPQYHQGGEIYGRPTKKEQEEKADKRKAYKEKSVKAKGDFEKAKKDIKTKKTKAGKARAGEMKDYRAAANKVRRDRTLTSRERTMELRRLQKENQKSGVKSGKSAKDRRKARRAARKKMKMEHVKAKIDTGQAVWGAEKSKLEKYKKKTSKKALGGKINPGVFVDEQWKQAWHDSGDVQKNGGKVDKYKKGGFVKKIVDKVKFNKSINLEKRQQIKDIKSKLKDDRKIAQDYRDKSMAAYERGDPRQVGVTHTQEERDEAMRAHFADMTWREKREKIAQVKKVARKAKRKGKKNPSAYKKGGFVKKIVKGIEKVADKAWEGADKVVGGRIMKFDKKLGKWLDKREKIVNVKRKARKKKQEARIGQTLHREYDFKTRREMKKKINAAKKARIKSIKKSKE